MMRNSEDDDSPVLRQRRVIIQEPSRGPRLPISEMLMSQTEPSDADTSEPGTRRATRDEDGGLRQLLTRRLTNDPTLELERPADERFRSFKLRTIWTTWLILSFIAIIAAGHFYCVLLVLVLSVGIFREIISLKRDTDKDSKLPYFNLLRWYFFAIMLSFVLRRSLSEQWDRLAATNPWFHFTLVYYPFISYSLICVGLIMFVLSLRKYTLRYQFTQLAWSLVTLIVIVSQLLGHIANIYQGLVWFLLPASLVIMNDIAAYVFGFFFGRTRLIKLSPKKTWEGFLGGSLCTIVWGWAFAGFMQHYPFFICPALEIHLTPFNNIPTCSSADHLLSHRSFLGVEMTQLQMHALFLSVFASLVAPFGGFFASGFKRAFKIKDFGDSIPGHGGITDRFDCQVIMGMFTHIYVMTYASPQSNLQYVDHLVAGILALPASSRSLAIQRLKEAGVY